MPIEGTKKSVRSFNHELTKNFHTELCQPQNIVVACAGNVEHQLIIELAQKYFGSSASPVNLSPVTNSAPVAAPIFVKKKKNLEQAHLIIAAPWISSSDERRYAASLLIGILGDGNSSRLWQTVREKHGLAYSVGATATSFRDCGVFSIYAGTSPEKLPQAIDLSVAELRKIKREGVSETELRLAKDQIAASILLGLEDSAARAANLAQHEITYGKQIPIEEILRRFEAVTIDEIRELTAEFFQTEKIAFGALGDLNGFKINRSRLEI